MRTGSPYSPAYTFGPGALTPAVRALVIANVAAYLVTLVVPSLEIPLGLIPAAVVQRLWIWQVVTYMFLHGGVFHILFNMLALWMFGVELERMWGTRFFVKYYFVAGLGAAATTILLSLLPFEFSDILYRSVTIGASGAVYGLLLAYGLYFPDPPIYIYMVFPIPAKYFVLIIGAISFLSSISGSGGGVAHAAHLGGLVSDYLYLKTGRGHPLIELRYRWSKWKLARSRRKFEVHKGGRGGDPPNRWVH
jgi:membrane associated rhomboid family serine protease